MARGSSFAAAVAIATVVGLLGSCSDGPHRPPPPPQLDSGTFDAAPLPDASPEPDAAIDPDGGPGSTTIHRDYGTDFDACPPVQIPLWGDLRWTATIPEGGSIRWSAQAAPQGESLSSAPRVTLGTTPPAESPLFVADHLAEEHRNDAQLRITALLRWASPDAQPAIDSMSVDWECLDRP